jgi:hypothetical protein
METLLLLIQDVFNDDALPHLLSGSLALIIGGTGAYKGAQVLFHREMDHLREQWNRDMKSLSVSVNHSFGVVEERTHRIEDKIEAGFERTHARITQNEAAIASLMERTRNL